MPAALIDRKVGVGRHLYPGLVLAQALHTFEKVVSGAYERLPAIAITPEFYVLIGLAIILLMAALIPSVGHGRPWAIRLARIIALIEILNGAAHLGMAAIEWSYFPGAWTAPLVLFFGLALTRSLRPSRPARPAD